MLPEPAMSTPGESGNGPVAIPSSLPSVEEWREPVVAARSSPVLEKLFRRRTGVVPAVVSYVAPHAWAYRPFLFLVNPDLKALDDRLASQICFVVARDNACRFCYGRFRTFLRVAGYSAAELDRLEHDLRPSGDDRSSAEALSAAVALSQGRLDRGVVLAPLREAGYGPTALREIVGVAGLATLINRVATMLAVPIEEDVEMIPQKWFFELVRPVLRSALSGWQSIAVQEAPPLRKGEAEGPLADWVERLRGTCVGHVVHDLVQKWMRGEGALSLRTKLLMLAVVARGLHDQRLEERATALLQERCGESAGAVATVVRHLRGDAVDGSEAALLRLARDSIRYEAGRMQAQVREQTRDLSRAETIDAIATLGLTNALARLRALAPLDD